MLKKEIISKYNNIGLSTNEAMAEFDMILDFLGIDKLKEFKEGFSKTETNSILNIIEQRTSTQMPLQHIVGFGYFMGERFLVDNSTLIPRPETEILVKECCSHLNQNSRVLDIGTGSGCIAIEISKLLDIKVDAIDISEKALQIAKKNSELHNAKCNFFISDLFENINQKYDLIVSNPPYIPIKEKSNLSKTVSFFEPSSALFANDELGIEFYKKIIEKSPCYLNNYGYLAFEIGINQAEHIEELLLSQGFSNTKIIKDLDGIKRVTISQYIK